MRIHLGTVGHAMDSTLAMNVAGGKYFTKSAAMRFAMCFEIDCLEAIAQSKQPKQLAQTETAVEYHAATSYRECQQA